MQHTSIPSPSSSSFTVGGFEVHYYALFILAGIIAALFVGSARMKRRGADGGLVLDIAIWAVPFGIIGGRIFHVLTHTADYFGDGKNILEVLYIWKGGLAIYGALIFGLIGAAIGAASTGYLAHFIDANVLKKFFGCAVLFLGVRMLINKVNLSRRKLPSHGMLGTISVSLASISSLLRDSKVASNSKLTSK